MPLPAECLHSLRDGRNIFAQPAYRRQKHRALFSGCVTEFSTHTAAFDEEVPFCFSVICRARTAVRRVLSDRVADAGMLERFAFEKAGRKAAVQRRPAQTTREKTGFSAKRPAVWFKR